MTVIEVYKLIQQSCVVTLYIHFLELRDDLLLVQIIELFSYDLVDQSCVLNRKISELFILCSSSMV